MACDYHTCALCCITVACSEHAALLPVKCSKRDIPVVYSPSPRVFDRTQKKKTHATEERGKEPVNQRNDFFVFFCLFFTLLKHKENCVQNIHENKNDRNEKNKESELDLAVGQVLVVTPREIKKKSEGATSQMYLRQRKRKKRRRGGYIFSFCYLSLH